jgi:hypothetical protein
MVKSVLSAKTVIPQNHAAEKSHWAMTTCLPGHNSSINNLPRMMRAARVKLKPASIGNNGKFPKL